jgi:hypothetical protein
MKLLSSFGFRSPVGSWVWLFLLIQGLTLIVGGPNPGARWAMLAAMVEDHSVNINHYWQYTCDWSRGPDRNYYSNKAPGPSLLSYPVFRVMDGMDAGELPTREQRDSRRGGKIDRTLHALSMLTQAIPFAWVTVLLIEEFRRLGAPRASLHLTAIALLFGNTASLFMNTFFGHSMAALFILATALSLMRRWPLRLGLFFGLALLCDYATMLLALPLLVAMVLMQLCRRRQLTRVALGGLGPAVVFAIYHWWCFGAPWILSTKYVNPEFVDIPRTQASIWGVLRIVPNFNVMDKLLFSAERGLLYTQPWVPLALALGLWVARPGLAQDLHRGRLRGLLVFALVGLSAMVWMNSCWGGWHGGQTCGPRYLASILPVAALLIPLLYPSLGPTLRQSLWVATVPAVVLFVLVFATEHVLVPLLPLHAYYFARLVSPANAQPLVHLMLLTTGFAWASYRAWHDIRAHDETADAPPSRPRLDQ